MLPQRFLLGVAGLTVGIKAQSEIQAAESTDGTSQPPLTIGTASKTATVTPTETVTETSTAADSPETHNVKVGLAGFTYAPDEITANPGDTVRFEFYPPDHSVIRAAFGYPCIPWDYVYAAGDPFYSGIQYVNTVAHTTTFDVLVNDTEPIFFYCGAPDSCLKEGMIGVINPNSTQTLEKQKAAREIFPIDLIPGDPWPSEGNPMSTISGLHVTETAVPPPGSTSGSESSNDDSDTHHKLSAGQIAGIAIGSAALLLLIGALVYFCGRRGGLEKGYRKSGYVGAAPQTTPAMGETVYPAGSPDMTKHASGVPSAHYGLGVNHTGTPPLSPGLSTIGAGNTMQPNQYGHPSPGQYGQSSPGIASPMMHGHQQYHQAMAPMPAEAPPAPAPVELPASADPGNSPLPRYSNQPGNTYSWAPQEESGYRPSDKS